MNKHEKFNLLNKETPKKANLPHKETKHINKIEKIGYTVANKIHKYAVLTVVGFIIFNIGMFAKQYNDHWRARRVNIILIILESKLFKRYRKKKIKIHLL